MSATTAPATTATTAPSSLLPSPTRLDLALTALVSTAGLLLAYSNYADGPTNPAADGGPFTVSALAIPFFLLMTLPLLWRSKAPLLGLGLFIAGTAVHWAAFGEIVHCGVAYPAAALLAYAAGRRLEGQGRMLGLGLAVLAPVVVGVTDFLGPETLVLGLPLALIAFGLGVAVAARSRRQAAGALLATA